MTLRFKILILISICLFIYLYAKDAFSALYRVQGDFTVDTKEESDTLKVDLAALSKITAPEKLEVIQEKDKDNKERVVNDIVFKDEQEARDYYKQLIKQNKNARVSLHRCTHIEYGESVNLPCVLELSDNLTKQ